MVVLCMPVFNEEEGITEFLFELNENLSKPHFVIVDDCSTDATKSVLNKLAKAGQLSMEIISNQVNRGHGVSTVIGMSRASEDPLSRVISIDGDGQFIGSEINAALKIASIEGYDILEGIRIRHGEPLFRRLTSFATRLLVLSRTGKFVRDANTPFRIYAPGVLHDLVESLPANCMTPNLRISVLARQRKLNIGCTEVQFIPRRGRESSGTTWQQKHSFIPSKRFVKFCYLATRQWWS